MYRHAKFHPDRRHRRQDICNRTQQKTAKTKRYPSTLRCAPYGGHNAIQTRCWHVTISCQPDERPQQPVRPWKSGRVHLAEGSNVVVLEQEIRSVELGVCPMQLFHFLITS